MQQRGHPPILGFRKLGGIIPGIKMLQELFLLALSVKLPQEQGVSKVPWPCKRGISSPESEGTEPALYPKRVRVIPKRGRHHLRGRVAVQHLAPAAQFVKNTRVGAAALPHRKMLFGMSSGSLRGAPVADRIARQQPDS